MNNSLISPTDHWMIWTFLICMAAVSILLEHKYNFAKKITGVVIAVVGGMIASSIGLMPMESTSYDVVWEYFIPIIIALLIMKMNIFSIFKETGRLMGAFHLSALGTVVGSFAAYYLLRDYVADLAAITPAMGASYLGGGINFVAMVALFEPSKEIVNATIVADSGVMIIYFLILIMLPASMLLRKIFPITAKTKQVTTDENSEAAHKDYWKPKPIGLVDIAKSLAIAFIIAACATKISLYFSGSDMPMLVQIILGQKYLLLTTLSLIFPLLFPKTAQSIRGNDEIATFFIFIFFVVLGLPASIKAVILGAPLMILFCAIILFFNFLLTMGLGKLFKFELEELVLAAALTSGGPMNGVAISISKQWYKLIIPSMMVGVWGYVIGNYVGYFIGLAIGA